MLIKNLLFGYYDTQCLSLVSQLGVADIIGDESVNISKIAELLQGVPSVRVRKLAEGIRSTS